MQLSRRSLLKATAVSGAAITLSSGLSATASPLQGCRRSRQQFRQRHW
ncbi:twin-arginine translocation signal domain-containing protein [Lawsonella clevelandensis]